ncbi:MAG TPA: CPBP family glutamic-type intramembrane protease [Acidimicrobiales bacterium]|nr:CPBP family glutamic-type intramembrane protease [Acidimicrobiales bacterium]
METTPAKGWYADPFGRHRYRFWDGARWTGYAADAEVLWDDVEPANAGIAEVDVAPVKPGVITAVLGYGIGVGLAILVDVLFHTVDKHDKYRLLHVIVSQLGLWSGLIGACVVVSRRRGTGSLRRDFDWRFRKIDVGLGLAGAFAGRLVGGIVVAPIPIPFRHPTAPEKDIFNRVARGPLDWIVLVLIVCVGAPLIEELFFRGLMQPRLVQRFGTAPGLVATALLFGAAHMINWQGRITFIYAASIAGGGLVLGLLRHLTGRLGPGTWAHFFFNAQAVALTALLT